MQQEPVARRENKLRSLILCALFAALTAAGAFIKVPGPFVPFTLQTFFVALAALMLGKQYGALSQGLYVFIGLVGMPVFTGGGGPQYVFQPSFGYLVGFILGAYIIGLVAERRKWTFWNLLLACCLGLAGIYVVGSVYLYLILNYSMAVPTPIWGGL